MTPEEIAQKVVDEWWEISGTLRGAIASAIRAEREAVLRALGPGSRFMDPPDGGDPTPAEQVANMRAVLDAAETERDRLRAERDSLMMRVNHGTPKDACYSTDDDPNCPLEHLWITRNGDLRAERDRLRDALELYRDAVRVDVKMEGPQFMGSNLSALRRAWEHDRKTDVCTSGGSPLNEEGA